MTDTKKNNILSFPLLPALSVSLFLSPVFSPAPPSPAALFLLSLCPLGKLVQLFIPSIPTPARWGEATRNVLRVLVPSPARGCRRLGTVR